MDESTLFVIRVWHGAAFRASVRRVDDEQTQEFDRVDDLARYLTSPSNIHESLSNAPKTRSA